MSFSPGADFDVLGQYMTVALDTRQALNVFNETISIDRIERATLVRHKPGRRCVILYDLVDAQGVQQSWVAKIRAKGLDRRSFDLSVWLYDHGFDSSSPDGVSVPDPIAAIPSLSMTVFRRVEGSSVVGLNADASSDLDLVARAIAKLHRAQAPINRTHTSQDEIRTLETGYLSLALERPEITNRLAALLSNLRARLSTDTSPAVLLHRDFYHDQVISSPNRVWILDLDLAARGPAALDVGNFIGHLIELAIRFPQRASALHESATRFREAYLNCMPEVPLASIRLYTAATLARHVYLCQRFDDRRAFIDAIFDAAESHL